LIDTCVVSEWKRRAPEPAVLAWLHTLTHDDILFSILTIGELRKGIVRLPAGRRRAELEAWLQELRDLHARQIISVSDGEVDAWADINAVAETRGIPVAAINGLLAATAQAHGLAVATRNVSDFVSTGVPVFDPWSGAWHNR